MIKYDHIDIKKQREMMENDYLFVVIIWSYFPSCDFPLVQPVIKRRSTGQGNHKRSRYGSHILSSLVGGTQGRTLSPVITLQG